MGAEASTRNAEPLKSELSQPNPALHSFDRFCRIHSTTAQSHAMISCSGLLDAVGRA